MQCPMTRGRYRLLLGGAMGLAAVVRFWGIDFGLPLTYVRPDERTLMSIAVRFGTGDLNPHFFNYPSLYMYLLFATYGVYFAIGSVLGSFESVRDFIASYDRAPQSFILVSRCLVATLGTLTVYFTARVSEELLGRAAGVAAAAFLALGFLHVRDSHFGTTDVPMTLFIVISMLYTVRAAQSGWTRDYLLAGLFAGLAASTKYAGALLVLPMLVAHARHLPDDIVSKLRGLGDARLLGYGAMSVAAFFAGTPFALLDLPKFLADLAFESQHLAEGHRVELPIGWIQHASVSLWHGMGGPLLVAAVAGIGLMLARRPREGLLLAAFPLVYYALAGRGYTVFVRYAVPLLPFLCIGAACALVEMAGQVERRLGARAAGIAAFAAALLLVAPSGASVLQFDRLLTERDNRLVVRDWIHANVPLGSSIHQTGPGRPLQGPQWSRVSLLPSAERLEAGLEGLVERSASPRRLRSLIDEQRGAGALPHYDEWEYDPGTGRFTSLGEPRAGLPAYMLVVRHPLRVLPPPDAGLVERIGTSYERVRAFDATRAPPGRNVYDEQDAFFVPFAGFHETDRPGPNYVLYRRRER